MGTCTGHAPCMLDAPCSVLRSWEVMGIFVRVFALQGVFSLCILHCWAFFRCVYHTAERFFSLRFFDARRFLHCVFSLQVVFSQRFFIHCRAFFVVHFTLLSRVFRCVFSLQGVFFVVHFVLCRVFALCILCCIAFSLRVVYFVLCCVFASCFDTFPEPQPTFPEPRPAFPEPRPTLPEPESYIS